MDPAPSASEQALSSALTASLCAGDGLGECLARFLHDIGAALAAERQVVYDYDERCDCFELLFFAGYPEKARSELSRKTPSAALRRATTTRDPYIFDLNGHELAIPLYFQETLEAVLVLSRAQRTWPPPADLAGVSRKWAVPLLEHSDRVGWTVRSGDERKSGQK